MDVNRMTLAGEYGRGEPLSSTRRLAGVREADADTSLFEWVADDSATSERMRTVVAETRNAEDDGHTLPFARGREETEESVTVSPVDA